MERAAAHRRVVAGRCLGCLLVVTALVLASGAVGQRPMTPGPPPRVFVFLSRAGGSSSLT